MTDLLTYTPGEPFPGAIGRTLSASTPAWPSKPAPPPGAPNVVVILLDDVGYGQLSAFGGPCRTPNIDAVAGRGLRYSNFHTTALCSPTRACLLTGRNHHTVGMSAITELALGFPAHDAVMGAEHGFLSEILVANGYNTFAVGKWHLTPPDETTAAGPFGRWPLGRGFERFYGFMGGDTDQWYPDLVHDNHAVRPPATPDEGYHLNADLADRAIDFISDAHTCAPDKPFFLWFATGAGHAPHQVEAEWVEDYHGAFDGGWDELRRQVYERQQAMGLVPAHAELPPRDPDVPAWDSLDDQARRMYARQMETYAGFISQTDHHIGRVLDAIERLGRLEDTIVVVMSDNGASAEGGVHGTRNETMFFNFAPNTLEDNLAVYDSWGGVDTFPHYSWGWTWAGDTPFRRWKRETYRGGVTDPCIVAWPARIAARGETRHQYLHAIDIAPTLLDAIGIEAPTTLAGVTQSPIEGASARASFDDPDAPAPRDTQYFEMFAHRSIYHQGWKAVCPFPGPSLAEGVERGHPFGSAVTEELLDQLDRDDWELYHLETDPTECHDLATQEPERLAALVALWWSEAERLGVLPLAATDLDRLLARRPRVGGERNRFRFLPGGAPIPFVTAPSTQNRTHAFTAEVELPAGAEGVLYHHGNRHGGFALVVEGGHLHYVHNYLGLERFTVTSAAPLPTGSSTLRAEIVATGPAQLLAGKGSPCEVRLYVDDRPVGFGELPHTVPAVYSMAGASCGQAWYDSVDPDRFQAPFAFTGTLHGVTLDLSGETLVDDRAEFTRMMVQQ